MSSSHVVVVGSGAVGASAAYYSALRGQRVTLIEQNQLGSGCSEGNAGQITPGHLPLPQPGTMRRNLRWLLSRTSPLYVRPRLDWSLAVWLLRFARACNPRQLNKATEILCRLGRLGGELFEELAGQFDFGYEFPGRLELCRSEQSFEAVQREAELLARFGFSHQVLRGDEVRQFEPAVVGNVAGAVFFPESGQCNPHRYSVVMAQAAEGLGARLLVETEVTDLRTEGDRVVSVTTSRGAIDADAVVLATGAWAPKLARRVGLRLPVQPGKGYHLDFDRTDRSPLRPVVAVQEKVFITPFDDILRLGGTMELSGFNFEPISERLDMLARGAAKYLEGIERREARSEWCHLRPMTPDGLPIIGPAPAFANVWVATGHGMLGITQGPSTGYLLAEAIATGDASVDLSEVRPNRKY